MRRGASLHAIVRMSAFTGYLKRLSWNFRHSMKGLSCQCGPLLPPMTMRRCLTHSTVAIHLPPGREALALQASFAWTSTPSRGLEGTVYPHRCEKSESATTTSWTSGPLIFIAGEDSTLDLGQKKSSDIYADLTCVLGGQENLGPPYLYHGPTRHLRRASMAKWTGKLQSTVFPSTLTNFFLHPRKLPPNTAKIPRVTGST